MAKVKKGKRSSGLGILPTPEREMIAGAVRMVATDTAGVQAAQVGDDCLLARAFWSGHLRDPSDRDDAPAQRRYDAGLWLRQLFYEKAALGPVIIGRYGEAQGTGDIEEHVAWNRKVYNDVHRALGAVARILEASVILDEPCRAMVLRKALDVLANHRGM